MKKNLLFSFRAFTLSIIILFLSCKKTYSISNLEITGIIADATTKEVLPNASVILFEKATNQLVKVEVSDLEGKFKISHLQSTIYKLRIQYMGYEEQLIDSLVIKESIQLAPIYLSPLSHKLLEVNVRATKPIIEQKANSTVINVSESALSIGGSAYDMLEKIPGINVRNNTINLHAKALSVFIDGRLINLSGEELINILQSLPASSINKMEITNNPTAKYDGQITAVLNIKTFKPKNNNLESSISIGLGAGRKMRSNSSINLFYKKNKISFSTSWNYLNNPSLNFATRNFFLPSYPTTLFHEYRKDENQQYSHAGKLDIDYEITANHSIGFSIQPMVNPRKIPVTSVTRISEKDSDQIDSTYNFSSNSDVKFTSLAGNIYYKTTFDSLKNKELFINADQYQYTRSWLGKYNTQILEFDNKEKGNPIIQSNDMPLDITIKSTTIDYTHTLPWGTWQTGFKSSWINVDNSSIWTYDENNSQTLNSFTSDRFLYAEYIQAIYAGFSTKLNKLKLDLSLRAEHTYSKSNPTQLQESFSRDYINLFPTINIEYNPCDLHQWVFLYRKTIRRPSYQELNPFLRIRTSNIYNQGNSFLIPELNHQLELSYTYNQFLITRFYFEKSFFRIGDLFQPISSTQQALGFKTINYESEYLASLNISINRPLTPWWTINTSVDLYIIQTFNYNFPTYPTANVGFEFFSTIALPHSWSLETSEVLEPPFKSPFYSFGLRSTSSIGIKKSFLNKQLNVSFLFSARVPYWTKETFSTYYSAFYGYDLRFFMASINYKIGSIKKGTKKIRIDTDRVRVKE